MKKNFLMYVIGAVLLGFISAEVLYNDYKNNIDESEYNAYLVQIGSFTNDSEINTGNYLVLEEDGIYNVYAGITTKFDNANKIKDVYASEDIEGVIKPVIIDNVEFMSNLEQFDILLSEVDNKENIKSINDVIISEYQEMVLQDE